jgi:hemoglobin
MDSQPTSNQRMPDDSPDHVYAFIGGMETCQRLAAAFYARVDSEPLLRHMFPGDLQQAIDHLGLFLAQRFGGPTTYDARRGHPRLRMRHAPFRIGPAERNAWIGHMLAAMDEVGIQEPARSIMRRYFEESATFLINAREDKQAIQLRAM